MEESRNLPAECEKYQNTLSKNIRISGPEIILGTDKNKDLALLLNF
jgi:hypothetical protein